ncbi:peptidoglycan-binding domain-containing protein [Sphingomonas rhizophila]|uniref:peptidoglycan-binding domain-containing protein n=1 Tax=Sphingomonas rhizophila TaxID=2071607 RepID=UPI0031B5DEC2
MRSRIAIAAAGLSLAAASVAQSPSPRSAWVSPGTNGSPIDGTVFHAQVLLDAAGFPAGVIDGKPGMSLRKAIEGFQEARGLDKTGKLDVATRQALLSQNRASTVMVRLTPDQVAGPFVYPFPKKPEDQAKLPALSYRNMLEKVAESFHTTPETIVALNGPKALIGPGQTLRLPNVLAANRDYEG